MANIKSAQKRILVAERNRLRNKAYKSAIKTLTKRYLEALQDYTDNPTPEQQTVVQQRMNVTVSKIDKAVKRGVFHRNTGARKKALLAKRLKQLAAA